MRRGHEGDCCLEHDYQKEKIRKPNLWPKVIVDDWGIYSLTIRRPEKAVHIQGRLSEVYFV